MKRVITAIDIGTTKLFGLVGNVSEKGIEIIGKEIIIPPKKWIEKGRIIDIEGVTEGLITLIESLTDQAKERIEWITIGIGGGFIRGKIYSKKMEIVPNGRSIIKSDIQTLEKEIKNMVLIEKGNKEKIIDFISQEYIVDDNLSVENPPIDIHCNRLEIKAHVLTAEINPLHDLESVAKSSGILIEKLYPSSWASAEAVINEEEKKLGCLVIDIGKSTTDIVFFADGKIILTDSLKVGSSNIDIDLSTKFKITVDYAEDLKKTYGRCDYTSFINNRIKNETIQLFGPKGKPIGYTSTKDISEIIFLRVSEIFEELIIKRKLLKLPEYPLKLSQVVITGGGAQLKGITKLAEEIFRVPIRLGIPRPLLNLDKYYQKPEFSTGIGLLLLALKNKEVEREGSALANLFKNFKSWFKKWFY